MVFLVSEAELKTWKIVKHVDPRVHFIYRTYKVWVSFSFDLTSRFGRLITFGRSL